jgi:predicted ATPase
LSLEEISAHLDDRFSLLTHGSRTALPRQQTLRAAIDWSYDLLSGPEQIFFKRLSVFAGGFTLEAAEVVAAGHDVLRSQATNLVGQLINKSLIAVEARSENADTRCGMLETIREYARERLDESEETEQLRQRHRDFFIMFAEKAAPKLRGAEQFVWLDRLEIEHDNLRAAWDCAIESDPQLASRLASALLDFWYMRARISEGREWLAKLLERTKHWGQSSGRAHVLGMAGRLANSQDDFATGQSLFEQVLPIARISGDKEEIAFALLSLGRAATNLYDDQNAQSLFEESLAIYQELQDKWGIALTMFQLGIVASNRGQYVEAEDLLMKSLTKFQELGDAFRMGNVLNFLGELMRIQHDYERAGRFYEANLEILREHKSRTGFGSATSNLAWMSLHRGDTRRARALFEESLRRFEDRGNRSGMTHCLSGFAGILAITGKSVKAARLFGAAEALLEHLVWGRRTYLPDMEDFEHYAAGVRGQLDEAAFAKAWEEGRAMTLEQAIEFALKETQV